ncbi:unnamed protein product [Miscanthus lutarioriparius]|uniref:NB-ARC domain-containing protein n=1 Tax=Miscanthus lutarioriparius TaxID=422564 RepID=A0A811NHV9_9POAL|nr:unnamed protein product [Miscanthus lutarioriparius]
MGSLLRRLDMLPCTDDGGSISELKDYIHSIRDKLKKLSEVQDPPLTVNYWMKHARELSYDIEAYLDGLDAQTENSLNDSDAKEGDDPDDSYAKMKDCIDNSDDETEYSVDYSQDEMEDNPDDSDANMEDPIDDDSDDETEETVDNSDNSTQDSICSSDYKISGFRTRAKGMIDRYERFGLDSVLSCPTAATTIVSPRPSRDVVLVGMGNQITKLMSLLQPKDENDNQLKIVSILGDEGIGKSTLIQELWRVSFKEKEIWPEPQSDVKIKRAFVRMGKMPDVRMILRSILSQVSLQEPAKDSGVTNLIQDIRKHLEQKRFVLAVYIDSHVG